jgi:hypothetical protein
MDSDAVDFDNWARMIAPLSSPHARLAKRFIDFGTNLPMGAPHPLVVANNDASVKTFQKLGVLDCCSNSARIKVVEKCSNSTVAIAWHDATGGNYGYQIWRKDHSKCAAICALSGHPIRAGDAVYCPQRSGRLPINVTAMILVSELSNVPGRRISKG